MKKIIVFFTFMIFAVSARQIFALEDGSAAGMGIMYSDSPYEGVDSGVSIVPLLVLEHKRFFIDGSVAGYYFNSSDEKMRFAFLAGPQLNGYSSGDSDILSGMNDRRSGFDAGVRIKFSNDIFDSKLEFVSDISGRHDGSRARLVISKEILKGFLVPKFGIIYSNRRFSDYYYGVRPEEVKPGRPQYSLSSTVDYLLGLRIGVPLRDNLVLAANIDAVFMSSETEKSPLVNEDYIMRYVLGAVYRF